MMDVVKDNPIKSGISILSAIILFVTTVFTMDGRYVHADEFTAHKTQQSNQLKQYRVEQRIMIDDLRKKQLEDKVFELEFKDKHNSLDNALLDRYKRELESLNRRLDSNSRLQNSLPTGD